MTRHFTKIRARLQYELARIYRLPQTLAVRTGQPNPAESKALLKRILTKNILPFWYPQAIDWENGGYRFDLDENGNWKSKSNKFLINQARTVWFFSRLSGSPYGMPEHLKSAQHGYDFLRNNLWDSRYGGFYWEVDPFGKAATKPDKHLYGQAFGLYALSEYALVSGDESATKLARSLFNLLETCAHDAQYGGYREFLHRDWRTPQDTIRGYRNNTAPTIKTQVTHNGEVKGNKVGAWKSPYHNERAVLKGEKTAESVPESKKSNRCLTR